MAGEGTISLKEHVEIVLRLKNEHDREMRTADQRAIDILAAATASQNTASTRNVAILVSIVAVLLSMAQMIFHK